MECWRLALFWEVLLLFVVSFRPLATRDTRLGTKKRVLTYNEKASMLSSEGHLFLGFF